GNDRPLLDPARLRRVSLLVVDGVATLGQRAHEVDLCERPELEGSAELRLIAPERAVNRSHELLVERVPSPGQAADIAPPLSLAVVLPVLLAVFLDEGLVTDREPDGSVVLRE